MPRPWLALLLISCTRANSLFLDSEGSSDATAGATTATTGASSTSAEPTTAATGTTGEPVPGTSSSATTAVGPLCGEFPTNPVGFNPLLSQPECESIQTFFVAVNPIGDSVELQICLDIDCLSCIPGLAATLPPELAQFFSPGSCLKAKHEGLWVDAGDPEVPTRCKTTGLALYDNATIYPLYAASARVLHAPSFLDPDVQLTVARAAEEACTCAPGDCCLGGQAKTFGLDFSYQGAPLGTYALGESFQPQLKEAIYSAGVLRAHAKGYLSSDTMKCVDEPETPYVEWAMIRLVGP